MTWYFHNTGEEFKEEHIDDNIGFVYIITHIASGRKYVGKKLFTKAKTRQIKGKKKRTRVSSDWQDYFGSNKTLQEEVKINGTDAYSREIIRLCKKRGELSYWETWEIFNRHALMSDGYYNEWVSCKIRKDHIFKSKGDTDTYES